MTTVSAGEIRYPLPDAPAPGALSEIAEGILWLRLPLPMALDHVNVFILDDGPCWTVVDTGFDGRRMRGIWTDVLNATLAGKPVGRVIVTHYHPDHIGLAGWLRSEHGAEIVTTRTSWLYARMLTLDVQPVPVAETLQHWRAAGMPDEMLARRATERPFNFADVVSPLPVGFTRIVEGDLLQAGGREWRVRIGDGHAPEHATLWSEDGELVLGGDQLLPSISPNLGVYATEPNADPVGDWLDSCARLAPHATQRQLVLPGHKLPYRGLPTRLRQLADNHHGAIDRLLDHLAQPRTAVECFDPLFKRPIGESEYSLALVEAVAHLNHMLGRGLVVRQLRKDGAWQWQRKT